MGHGLNLEGIYFRNCRYEDIPMVMKINRAVLPENYSRGLFLALWRFFKDVIFVAIDEENEQPVGYIINKVEEAKSFFSQDVVLKGHIFSLGVLPKYRRRGIGKALLSLGVVAMVEKRGVRELFLEVRVSNKAAISLYRKFNMKPLATIPKYYADGEAAYVMVAKAEEMMEVAKETYDEVLKLGKLR